MNKMVRIRRVRVTKYEDLLRAQCNIAPELFAIAEKLEPAVCFEVTFPFAEDIVNDGSMSLLAMKPAKGQNELDKKAVWLDTIDGKTEEEVYTEFEACCTRSTDHALSIVLDGEVEIYSWRHVGHPLLDGKLTEGEEYIKYFPLNRLGPGEIVGLFGTSDVIEASIRGSIPRTDKGQPWSAVAGRRCFSFEFPKPLKQCAPEAYRNSFDRLFPIAATLRVRDAVENIPESRRMKPYMDIVNKNPAKQSHKDAQKVNVVSHFDEVVYQSLCSIIHGFGDGDEERKGEAPPPGSTRLLVIPDYYILDDSNDKPKLALAKIRLQRKLLASAWEQSEQLRDAAWKHGMILPGSEEVSGHHARSVLNHLIDVVDGRAYCLRPVDEEEDGHIYRAWRELCELWSQQRLWDEACFPLVLVYGKKLPPTGIPCIVLPMMLPLNSITIDMEDVDEVHGQSSVIAEVLESYERSVKCLYEKEHVDVLGKFMDEWKAGQGSQVVGTKLQDGKQREVRLLDVSVRKSKGGNLHPYVSRAFILMRG